MKRRRQKRTAPGRAVNQFLKAEPSFLRSEPARILIGELRDDESSPGACSLTPANELIHGPLMPKGEALG